MKIDISLVDSVTREGLNLLKDILGLIISEEGLRLELAKGDDLEVTCDEHVLKISYANKAQFYRGIGIAVEKWSKNHTFTHKETALMDTMGPMLDMSQNGVMHVSAIKKMLRMMALMGMNRFYLYLEDIYQVDSIPQFGYMRGAYSYNELKIIDDYAYILGIEVIPIIQTLGHLQTALRWKYMDSIRDTKDILMVGETETYEFIRSLMSSVSRCFRSKQIHLGMDESTQLGLGQYLSKNGYGDKTQMMMSHLEKVTEIARRMGLSPMIWSDMFFRLCSETHDYYDMDAKVNQRIKDAIPDDLTLVYWDYYHHHESHYDHMISMHQEMSDNLVFAGGIWTWNSGTTNYRKTFDTLNAGLSSCKKKGLKDCMITIWGDDGTETNYFGALLGLQLAAEHCYNKDVEEEALAERFKICTGGDYELFRLMDHFDQTPGTDYTGGKDPVYNPSKYCLWQDLLMGLFDENIKGLGLADHYDELATRYEALENTDDWMCLHNHYALLAKVLSLKAELGIEIKAAYDKKHMLALRALVDNEMSLLEAYVEKLHESHRQLWFKTNKPFGWEVLDIRYGGLLSRINSAGKRLQSYLDGDISIVEELEQNRHLYDGGFNFNDQMMLTENKYAHIVTAGQFNHNPGG